MRLLSGKLVITVGAVASLIGLFHHYGPRLGNRPVVDSPDLQHPTTPPVLDTSTSPAESPPAKQPDFPADWQPTDEPRVWKSIVLHHTATKQGSVESIHEAHLARKWLGIGYHFVIGNGKGMADGSVEPTFRWRQQLHGAHAGHKAHNDSGIGIVLIGNFEEEPPTPAQLDSLKRLITALQVQYDIPVDQILPHSEVKATACPGKLFPLHDVHQYARQVRDGSPFVMTARVFSTTHSGLRIDNEVRP